MDRTRNKDRAAAHPTSIATDPSTGPAPGLPLLSTRDLADYLSVTPRTIERYRQEGGGPPFIRLNARAVRYRMEEVLEWLDSKVEGGR